MAVLTFIDGSARRIGQGSDMTVQTISAASETKSAAGVSTLLSVSGLAKSYGATIAVRNVDLEIAPGEIHALLGENGAGKSTFVKILSGIVMPDRGTMMLDGAPYAPHTLMDARAKGVSTAFQELSLLPNLSVASNLMLPRLLKNRAYLASKRRNEERGGALLCEFNVSTIHPGSLVGDLTLAEKQRVEIVRALSRRPRLLVLDEPTAALAEPEWLFELVDRIAGQGTSILYISHRMGEVRRLCARGTVLRNGQSISSFDLAAMRDDDVFRMMVGTQPEHHPTAAAAKNGATRRAGLEVRDLRGPGVGGISFDVAGGEIVGLAGLEGQGQRALFRMIAGADPISSGSVAVEEKPARLGDPAQALRSGIGYLPEERKTEGIFLGLETSSNMSLPILTKLKHFGLIDRKREDEQVSAVARKVDLPTRYLRMKVGALSGGNQQKALLGRVLLSGARNLVLFDPTRGVDVGTKQVIYEVIRDFAAKGGSVLLYSTELSELVHLVDRCLVIYRGRIAGEASGSTLREEELVRLATGH